MNHIAEYLDYKSIGCPRAAVNYRKWLERFRDFTKDKDPKEFKQGDFNSFYRYWETKVRPATLSLGMIAIRDYVRYLSKHRYTEFDYDYVPMVKSGIFGHHESVGPPEVDQMLTAIIKSEDHIFRKLRNTAILSFLFDTGVRVSELIGLDEANLNFEKREGMVKVLKKKKQNEYGFLFWTEQTDKILNEYIRMKRLITNHPSLFISLDKGNNFLGRITQRSVQRMIREICQLAGITRHIVTHSFRRGFAIDTVKKGGTNADVMNFLRHASLESTRPYTVYNPMEIRDRYRQLHGD